MFCPDYAGPATENGSYKATIAWNPWNEVSMVQQKMIPRMKSKMTMQVRERKSRLKTKDINTNITIKRATHLVILKEYNEQKETLKEICGRINSYSYFLSPL